MVTVVTTWGRGRTCASGSGRVDVVVMVVVVGSVDVGSSVSGGAWW